MSASATPLHTFETFFHRREQGIAQTLGITGFIVCQKAESDQQFDIAPRDLRLRPVQPFPLAPAKATHSNGSGGVAGVLSV